MTAASIFTYRNYLHKWEKEVAGAKWKICCIALHYYVKNDKRSMYDEEIELTQITWTTELFHAHI